MSSRLTAFILALFTATAVGAVDWEAFAAASDPSLDPALLDAMAGGDQETRISICRGVTRRKDPSIGVFIESLAADHAGTHDWRVEHCLRVLLDGLLDPRRSAEELRARADANAASMDVLFFHAPEWQDPQLLGLLMRAASLHPTPEGLKAVMSVGQRIRDELSDGKGHLMPQETSLALDYLASARSLAREELLPQCTDMARLSCDKVLVDAARSAAKAMAGR